MIRAAYIFAVLGLVVPPIPCMAGESLTVNIWPGKVPGDKGDVPPEKVLEQVPGKKLVRRVTNVSQPTITVFRPAKEKDTGVAVLVCPGGAYSILAMDLEGEEVAAWLNSLGVTGIVLKYRVVQRKDSGPRMTAPLEPLQDAQRALSLVRSKAKEWGLDPGRIGMMGFSAGAHLTAAAETNFDRRSYEPIDDVDRLSCRPDFAVLMYVGLLVDNEDKTRLRPTIRVSKDSPPTFFAMASNDQMAVDNSLTMFQALRTAGVPVEMHIYTTGGHGFGLRPSTDPCSTWPQRCADWLRNQRLLPDQLTKE